MYKINAMNKKDFRVQTKDIKSKHIISGQKFSDCSISKTLHKILKKYIQFHCKHKQGRKKINILLYTPLPSEYNITPLLKKIRASSIFHIFVPFMQGISFKMVSFRMPLFMNKFGIKEPMNSNFNSNKVDIMVVPMMGIDNQVKRIGYGKGMYDRFYAALKNKPMVIFVARELFYTKNTITNKYDINAHIVITKNTLLTKVRNNDRVDYPKFYRFCHHRRSYHISYFQKNPYSKL